MATDFPKWLRIEGNTIIFDILPTQIIALEELPKAVEGIFQHFSANKAELIKITGRAPIWLYTAVVHVVAHLTKAVAVFDAINNTYIIVVSHHPKYKLGQKLKS